MSKIKFLSKLILFLLVVLSFSCDDDNSLIVTDDQNKELRISIWKDGINHLKNNHPEANSNLNKSFITPKSNSNNELMYSQTYGFAIYTNNVSFYQLEGSQGMIDIYTFQVYKDNSTPNVLYNFLLRVNPDGSALQALVSYPYQYQNNEILYDNTGTTVQLITGEDFFINKCAPQIIDTVTITFCETPCDHPNGNHTDPEQCNCFGVGNGSSCNPPTDCTTLTVNIFDDCGGGSTSDPSDGNNTNNPPNNNYPGGTGSNTGGDGSSIFDNNTPLIPSEGVLVSQDVQNFINNLPQEQQDWLNGLNDCSAISIAGTTSCNQSLWDNIILFLNSNVGDANLTQEIIDRHGEIYTAELNNTLVSASPFFKFPENSNYETLYPKFTEYVKNRIPEVAEIDIIVDAINEITDVPIEDIKSDLEWGQGPTIEVVQLDQYNENSDEDTIGAFDKTNPGVILIDIDWVNDLENDTSDTFTENDPLLLFLGVTILHEYVHSINMVDGVDYPGEEGDAFEIKAYGTYVTPNAAKWLMFQRKNL